MPAPPELYERLDDLPEHIIGEIIDGEVVTTRLLPPRGALAKTGLAAIILNQLKSEWWILPAVEVELGDDVLVPDIAGWMRKRVPRLPDSRGMQLAPDWICEVLSPSTGRLDRAKKLPIYAREAVSFAWLVDPLQKTVEVMKLDANVWRIVHVYAGEEQMSAPPFDAIAIDLATIWV